MGYLAVIFCYMLRKINHNRSIYGIYHILKGKKSAQTIQDCHLFRVEKVFGVLKQLNRSTVSETINILENHKMINRIDEDRFSLTDKGINFLSKEMEKNPLPSFLNGFLHKDDSDEFSNRIMLTIQSLSLIKGKDPHFIPVIKDRECQLWVKQLIMFSRVNLENMLRALYHELKTVLNHFSTTEATLFVLRLTGAHRIGLTNEQAANKLQLDPYYSELLFRGVLHGIIEIVQKNKEYYPYLNRFLENLSKNSLLTETSSNTLMLLRKGYSLVDIGRVRGLKQSTVEDHIVEIAMTDKNFSIDPFVTKEEQHLIEKIIKELNTRRLKEIKLKLDRDISYFAIRLTLAKKGGSYEFK